MSGRDPAISPAGGGAGNLAQSAERPASGELGAVELLESTLAGIEASQGTLNAFRLLRPKAARAEAVEAERRLLTGERLPLLGVPIALRDDNLDLKGAPTAFGCPGRFEPRKSDGAVAEAEARGRRRGDRRQDQLARDRPLTLPRAPFSA
ncbi:MAG: amidase family protein [Solirubrobacterales bacterium]